MNCKFMTANNALLHKVFMLLERMGWGRLFATMAYGDFWRAHRRLFAQQFDSQSTSKHYRQQTKAVHNLLRHLLETPELWQEHLRL